MEPAKILGEFYMSMGSNFRLSPFKFHKNVEPGQRYEAIAKRSDWLFFFTLETLLLVVTAYKIWLFYNHFTSTTKPGLDTVLFSLYVALHLFVGLNSLNNVILYKQLVQLLNASDRVINQGLHGDSAVYKDEALQGLLVGGIAEMLMYVILWGCGLPLFLHHVPWFLFSGTVLPDSLKMLENYILKPAVESAVIVWIMCSVYQSWIPGVVGLTTIRLWSNSLSSHVEGRTAAALTRSFKQLQLYSRVNNDWMSAFYVPIMNLAFFSAFCWALYSTVVLYGDENIPLYVYAIFPVMLVYMASAIPSYMLPLGAITNTTNRVSMEIYQGNRAESLASVVDTVRNRGKRQVRHHTVTISKLSGRHRLIPVRPIMIDMGAGGSYVTMGTGFRIMEEASNYALLLIVLHNRR